MMLLRFPHSMHQQAVPLGHLIQQQSRGSGAPPGWAFEMSGPERVFARAFLARYTHVWLFRADQRKRCGDFVMVDMSNPRIDRRQVWVVELKSRPSGHAGLQLSNAHLATQELVQRGVTGRGCPVCVTTTARGGLHVPRRSDQ